MCNYSTLFYYKSINDHPLPTTQREPGYRDHTWSKSVFIPSLLLTILPSYTNRLILFWSVGEVLDLKNWNIPPNLTAPPRLPRRATYPAHGSYERWAHDEHVHTTFSRIQHQANTFSTRWRSPPFEKLKYSANFDRTSSTTQETYISSSWLIWKMSSWRAHTYQI